MGKYYMDQTKHDILQPLVYKESSQYLNDWLPHHQRGVTGYKTPAAKSPGTLPGTPCLLFMPLIHPIVPCPVSISD